MLSQESSDTEVTKAGAGHSVGASAPDARTEGAGELRHYLTLLGRRKLLIAVVVAAATLAAAAFTMLPAQRWSGTAIMRVEPGAVVTGGAVRADDLAYLDRLINTYAKLVSSDTFADAVADELRVDEAPELEVAGIATTNLMEIRATTSGQATAAEAANAAASALVDNVRRAAAAESQAAEAALRRRARRLETDIARARAELEDLRSVPQSRGSRVRALQLSEEITGTRLSLTALRDGYEASRPARDARASSLSLETPASPPAQADGRNLSTALVLGVVLGLLGGVGLAFVLESLSRRFHSGDEIEAWVQAPVLAAIPEVDGAAANPVFDGASPAEEGFRRLRTTLLVRSRDRFPTLLVASAWAGEGKSTVVANLGYSLSQSGRRVALVDADLRAPQLHKLLGARQNRGLADLLSRRSGATPKWTLEPCRPTAFPRLFLLSAGKAVDDPATLLGSDAMGTLLDELGQQFDCVLIDSPAILAVADALALVQHVDAVALVAGSGVTRDALSRADRELRRSGASVLGVVINRVSDPGLYPYAGRDTAHRDRESLRSGLHLSRVGR